MKEAAGAKRTLERELKRAKFNAENVKSQAEFEKYEPILKEAQAKYDKVVATEKKVKETIERVGKEKSGLKAEFEKQQAATKKMTKEYREEGL